MDSSTSAASAAPQAPWFATIGNKLHRRGISRGDARKQAAVFARRALTQDEAAQVLAGWDSTRMSKAVA